MCIIIEDTPKLISPIFGEPLLLVEGDEQRTVIAADIHLGLEYELWQGGISIPSQTKKMLSRLQNRLAEIKPDRLILLGDIKHNVPRTSWQEKKEVPDFLKSLSNDYRVDIVPGNHDSNIAEMAPKGVQLRPSSGYVLDNVGYFHGHTWPDDKTMKAELLVTAHLHPAIRLKDPVGSPLTRQVWAKSKLTNAKIQEKYGTHPNTQVIVMPAFNQLCGGLPLNEPIEDQRGPIMEMVDLDSMHIYLLDGTDLGILTEIKKCEK